LPRARSAHPERFILAREGFFFVQKLQDADDISSLVSESGGKAIAAL